MMKALLLAALFISACYAGDYYCTDFYQGVDGNQPFATGFTDTNYYDDTGEFYADEEFKSNITEFTNGTYVSQGTYQQKVQVTVYNQYFPGCYRQAYDNRTVKSYNFTREGYRSPSQFGQNFTSEQVSPFYNATLREILLEFAKTYSEKPQAEPYITQTLEKFAQKVQVNNIEQN
ncbi:hypothetical protein TTHERM_00112700 (macronuclear) [Tetrahymena thermophila SB210]|uniref:Transmembrane protein n=1 Tax=Tetrahymena thermophila (strain SB210) TaxID=312017 RepID=Q22ZA1_TETTS|nr:hypothetical protein TTHERM_00112700 [Tetrahymena thermophila SB210]EAR90420.3 hypothetical protein TTHERM_00112700 [Tetrahymena thermophila SB210]|eukprot:XP_001010665.3 hypothetical protein TTHERM_00112700 [Tetrahymena thermophila SB210]